VNFFFFELSDLSDYFQVQNLTKLLLKGIKSYLTSELAGKFLLGIRERNLVRLRSFMVSYIMTNFRELVQAEFPFHKMGKIMLTKVFKGLAGDDDEDDDDCADDESENDGETVFPKTPQMEDEQDEEIEEY
jgi:hypothetical protein